jgi:endonuclease YncB( thermonuclease family)
MGILLALAGSTASLLCASPSVHDGDTIRCGAERIRIANIDAPELPGSPKCEDRRRAYAWCDFAKGYEARDALRAFLERGPVRITRQGVDQYGRTLARIRVNGVDAGEYLVHHGLARRWD